jgi:hypothetical protein
MPALAPSPRRAHRAVHQSRIESSLEEAYVNQGLRLEFCTRAFGDLSLNEIEAE